MGACNLALIIFHSAFSCFEQKGYHSLQAHQFVLVIVSFYTTSNLGFAVALPTGFCYLLIIALKFTL
jgi:hypothetical protein